MGNCGARDKNEKNTFELVNKLKIKIISHDF